MVYRFRLTFFNFFRLSLLQKWLFTLCAILIMSGGWFVVFYFQIKNMLLKKQEAIAMLHEQNKNISHELQDHEKYVDGMLHSSTESNDPVSMIFCCIHKHNLTCKSLMPLSNLTQDASERHLYSIELYGAYDNILAFIAELFEQQRLCKLNGIELQRSQSEMVALVIRVTLFNSV